MQYQRHDEIIMTTFVLGCHYLLTLMKIFCPNHTPLPYIYSKGFEPKICIVGAKMACARPPKGGFEKNEEAPITPPSPNFW